MRPRRRWEVSWDQVQILQARKRDSTIHVTRTTAIILAHYYRDWQTCEQLLLIFKTDMQKTVDKQQPRLFISLHN